MQEPGESRGASRWCGSRRGAPGARPAGLVEQRPLRLAGLTREACGTRTRGAGSRARGPAAAPRRRRDPLGVRLLRCRPAGQGWCPAPVGRARCGVRDASLEWARRLVVCRCVHAPARGGAHQHPYSGGDLRRRGFLSCAVVRRRLPGSATSREGRMVRRVSRSGNGEWSVREGRRPPSPHSNHCTTPKEEQEKKMS